jgi:diaminopimelate decarboxylase
MFQDREEKALYLHGTSRINEQGHLEIGGIDAVDLVKQFGSPLYVMDEAYIRNQCRLYVESFRASGLPFQVAYASKAFSTMAMCRLVQEEGLSLDVVSAGELYTALKAGFPPEKIHFHGNNKTPDEIELALDADIGSFVIDNFTEITLLDGIAQQKGKKVNVLIRVTPGIEAHTHEYIQTGQADSKFGFDLASGQAAEAVRIVLDKPALNLIGFHCHIGSQIFDVAGFAAAIQRMGQFMKGIKEQFQYEARVFNVGGGFGIRYTSEDQPLPIPAYVESITQAIKTTFDQFSLAYPEIWVEPGRSIVGEAGTTLYTVGTIKHIPGVRKYIAVDGGMTDNPRPALYQARYEAVLANKAAQAAREVVSVAGKCCESGDMLIWDIALPEVEVGDILAVFCTGAYNYSMASNYNRIGRPAVVFVKDGKADLVVERESLEDLIRLDRIPARMSYSVAP